MTRKLAAATIAWFLVAGVAYATWDDDYDAGIKAARAGQWQTVVQKMSAAIAAKPQENNKAKTYGTIFVNYHPYYYRGAAYLYLGQYDKALSDLEKTTGAGEFDMGTIENLAERAKRKQAEANEPQPQPQPPPVNPPPVRPPVQQPTGPTITPAVRQQLTAAISEANQALANARNRKATSSPQYGQALQQLADATTKGGSAKSDDDLNAAIASANNAKMFADSATGQSVIAVAPPPTATQPPPTRVQGATNATLAPTAQRVRRALEAYFHGEFDQAAAEFSVLSRDLPTNGWIYAFLGASQYSLYAFEADERYRDQAIESFRKAKKKFPKGLPERYFSKRIRKVFDGVG